MAAKVNYVGNYAVVTQVNEALAYAEVSMLRMMGAPVDTYLTGIYEVGEGSVADAITDNETMFKNLRHLSTHTEDVPGSGKFTSLDEAEKAAEVYHDAMVDALKADTLVLVNNITRDDYLNTIKASVKPIPKSL
jgi:hypothetical protein